jgi:hypothetical protein
MSWYAAHRLFYVKLKHRRQRRFHVYENIVLISARTQEDAFAKAEKRGWDDAFMQPDDSFRWDGEPAEFVFAGVRKLTACMDEERRPGDGTEVTYIELDVGSKADLEKLIACQPVAVRIEDGFPAELPAGDAAAATNGRRKS